MPLTFRRPPRTPLPSPPTGEVVLQPPPTLPRHSWQAWLPLLFMFPMMLGMGAMSFTFISRAGGAMMVVFGTLFVGMLVGMVALGFARGSMTKKAQINDERRDYQRYLAGVRRQAHTVATTQRAGMVLRHPDPRGLWAVALSPRLWERRRADADFLHARIGVGPQRLATPLKAPQTAPLEDLDPVSSTALRSLIRATSTVPELPVVVALRSYPRIRLSAERGAGLAALRAVLAALATMHSPEDLRIALCLAPGRHGDWEWAKWLPHTADPRRWDGYGPLRLVAGDLAEIADRAAPPPGAGHPGAGQPGESAGGHLVVIVDGGGTGSGPLATEAGVAGVTVVILEEPGAAPVAEPALRLVVDDGTIGVRTPTGVRLTGVADQLDQESARTLARLMGRHYRPEPPRRDGGPTTHELAGLLGIDDPRQLDVERLWRARPAPMRLRVPIGVRRDGTPLELDFKESAEGGMGPHGLIIGATGSGKSELLRTLVSALALTHSSQALNFVLVDFKGGATFAGLGDLPHTAAVITNLADDLTLVDRMQDALHGELIRRQELLRAAGNFASVRDYERAREAGRELAPLPTLMVIIDEFSELLAGQPEFIDLFVMIGRLGRSLAVHLLLASQRLEEGKLRGLDSHLSYRIGLRTFSAAESRVVLGVPDAHELPPVPGSAYLRLDAETLIRFKAAYVSGAAPRRLAGESGSAPPPPRRRIHRFALAGAGDDPAATADGDPAAPAGAGAAPAPDPAAAAAPGETVLDVMVAQLVGRGTPPHQVWLPPLAQPPSLDAILPPLAVLPDRGLSPVGWPGAGGLRVPIGVVDKPFEQKRDLLWADLSAAAGHAVVVGAPRSGKSMLLRTLVASLALTHTAAEVQCYLLDFGGGSLQSLAGLPHVGAVAGRREAELVSRTVAEVTALLAEREQLFTERGIDSMAAYRATASRDGRGFGDVFLVVDGWMVLRQEYEALEETITAIAARGLGYGIHVVLSANRWMEVRPALRDTIGTRFELRLGDPMDSEIDRRTSASIPQTAPGRGITRERLHFLTAVPRIDGVAGTDGLGEAVAGLVTDVTAGWSGAVAPPVRLLPRVVTAAQLPAPRPGEGARLPIGVDEAELRPVWLDFAEEPHLIVFGDSGSGKTALLRGIAAGITSRLGPERARLLVVDYRRSLLGEIGQEHLSGYAGSQPVLTELVEQALVSLRGRIPGPEVTPEQLRTRSWWSGPELFLLVDDYDLVVTQTGNPLAPLAELLPQARDIGLHLVLARRSGGASRALYEPVLQRLRDLGTAGLLLAGDPEEGPLLGTVKPTPQPPGRGHLVSRRSGTRLVQVVWHPPSAE